jgi:hypothetical protein
MAYQNRYEVEELTRGLIDCLESCLQENNLNIDCLASEAGGQHDHSNDKGKRSLLVMAAVFHSSHPSSVSAFCHAVSMSQRVSADC